MFMRLLGGVRTLVLVLMVAVLLAGAILRPCTRAGCYWSVVGRWMLNQGGAFADVARTVEGGTTVIVVVVIVGYSVSRLRARL